MQLGGETHAYVMRWSAEYEGWMRVGWGDTGGPGRYMMVAFLRAEKVDFVVSVWQKKEGDMIGNR